ncbi:MAG: deoxyribonuclease IV [Solirubrobacteraceae bacterium]|nr:deoxyribonuclease IV [Solirubrobacteraceae bacterium]
MRIVVCGRAPQAAQGMLIGAHVSPAGGPANAVARGVERGARAIQIFNQNPRAWKPRDYSADEVAAFRAAIAGSDVDALLIHAVYLLNCASNDATIRANTLRSLIASLRAGAALGAHAVVLHPGSAKTGDVGEAIARAGTVIAEALAETDGCALHLENTAGSGGTLGRSFDELAALIEAAGGDARLGVCLDSCHLLASGHEIRSAEALAAVLDECGARVGLERLGSLHLNDSQTPLGSNVDRHANVGDGELGEDGCAVFLSEPRFEGLPLVLETPGPRHSGPTSEELALTRTLRERGIAARRR